MGGDKERRMLWEYIEEFREEEIIDGYMGWLKRRLNYEGKESLQRNKF